MSWGIGCLALIPVLFMVFGGVWLFFSISRVTNQTTASGVVVDIDSRYDSDGDLSYRPVIEFVATDGDVYQFTGRTGSSSRPTIGGSIDVLYDPADPQGATEKTFVNLWLFPIAFGGFGALFLILMVFARSRNRRKAAAELRDVRSLADAVSHTLYGAGTPPGDTEAATASTAVPVGGTTAEFRRAEATISADGTIRYRIVAKDDAGNEYYSELLDEDPTPVLMRRGNEVQLVESHGRLVVHYEPDRT